MRILTIAKNLYGALLAAGVGAMLMTQVFVNVGGNVGIMPITGIPLPLMSYGGSSVIVTLIALGLLQSVYVQAREAAASKSEATRMRPRSRVHVARTEVQQGDFMRKQVLVSVDRGETRVAILESKEAAAGKDRREQRAEGSRRSVDPDWRVAELYIERRGRRSIVGNVYKGRVDNVLAGMEAAFVDIGLEKNGFLHVDEIVTPDGKTHAPRPRPAAAARGSRTC